MAPSFFGGNMNKLWLIMLGVGVICMLIIILLDVINELLKGRNS